jgi:hypothetical protein
MAPPLTHPPGVNFIDDDAHRHVHSEASQYYGGPEYHTRARTYSAVSTCILYYVCRRGGANERGRGMMKGRLQVG